MYCPSKKPWLARNTKLFTVCGAFFGSSSISIVPHDVTIVAMYVFSGSIFMGGGPENCGLDLPAVFGASAPHATSSGAGWGSTVPVCVPGFACGVGLLGSRWDCGRTHRRRGTRCVVATGEDHQTGHDQQDDRRGRRDRADRALPATALRVALRLPAGSELRQVSVSGTLGHPGDEPIGCPTVRRPRRPGVRLAHQRRSKPNRGIETSGSARQR